MIRCVLWDLCCQWVQVVLWGLFGLCRLYGLLCLYLLLHPLYRFDPFGLYGLWRRLCLWCPWDLSRL